MEKKFSELLNFDEDKEGKFRWLLSRETDFMTSSLEEGRKYPYERAEKLVKAAKKIKGCDYADLLRSLVTEIGMMMIFFCVCHI